MQLILLLVSDQNPRGATELGSGRIERAGGDQGIAGEPKPFAGGKSGLQRAGRSLTATRGDPRESATETTPPMAGDPRGVVRDDARGGSGKVEIVG